MLKATCRELNTLSHDALAPVMVETAAPLGSEAKQMIESAIGAPKNTAAFHVVPELVAGVRISMRHGLIDASVAGLAHFAEQSLREEITAMIQEEPNDA